VKHRSRATALIVAGGVRLNHARVEKPGHGVKPGDILTLTLPGGPRVVRVVAEAQRRGPAAEARRLYEDLAGGEIDPSVPPQTCI